MMRSLFFLIGLGLMVLGVYWFTTHAYPWWRGIAADVSVISLAIGIFMLVFLEGEAKILGWIGVAVGIICIFVSSRAILNPTSLWQFFLAFGSMSVGYKMMTTRRSPF